MTFSLPKTLMTLNDTQRLRVKRKFLTENHLVSY